MTFKNVETVWGKSCFYWKSYCILNCCHATEKYNQVCSIAFWVRSHLPWELPDTGSVMALTWSRQSSFKSNRAYCLIGSTRTVIIAQDGVRVLCRTVLSVLHGFTFLLFFFSISIKVELFICHCFSFRERLTVVWH